MLEIYDNNVLIGTFNGFKDYEVINVDEDMDEVIDKWNSGFTLDIYCSYDIEDIINESD